MPRNPHRKNTFRQRNRAELPDLLEKKQRKSHFARFMVFSAPLMIGAAAGGIKYWRMHDKATDLKEQITVKSQMVKQDFTRDVYSKIVKKMVKEPGYKQHVADLCTTKNLKNPSDKIEIGLDVLKDNPSLLTRLFETSFAVSNETMLLQAELKETERATPIAVAQTFGFTSAFLYALVVASYAWKYLPAYLHKKHPKSEPDESDDPGIPDCSAPFQQLRFAIVSEPIPAKPLASGSGADKHGIMERFHKLVQGPASDEKNHGGTRPDEQPSFFSAEVCAALAQEGLKPTRVEKTIVRAFKTLSAKKILVGDRCADTAEIRGIVGGFFKEPELNKFWAMMEREGMLHYSEDRASVSLESQPEGGLGRLMMSDIAAKLVSMSRRGKKTGTSDQ